MQTSSPQQQHLAQNNPMQMLMQMQMQMFRGMMNMNQNGNSNNMQAEDPHISFQQPAAEHHRRRPALTNGSPASPREESPADNIVQDNSAMDDIDAMLGNVGSPAPIDKSKPATIDKKKKAPSAPPSKVQKKEKTASIIRRPSAAVGSRPKLTDTFPILWKGCKVYSGTGKFRVLPKPGISLYDKSFAHGGDKELAFKKALEFCDNPIIPSSSVNFA